MRTLRFPWPDNLLVRMAPQENGCIYFTGATNPRGYGYVRREGRTTLVHRAAYEHFVGPIPEGHDIDHECHNRDRSCPGGDGCLHRRCVNPRHLTPRRNGDNSRASARSVPSVNKAKTHCPQGHPYDEENTLTDPRGSRRCRPCAAEARRKWRERT